MIWEELEKSLIVHGLQADTYEDVMKQLGGALIREGYAKESYVDALIAREQDFPTGLDIDGLGVAIPHTDVSHVIKGGIAIAVLDKPVTFIEMGSDDDPVDVQLVFMLAVIEPKAHMERLQRILAIIQDKEVLEKIVNTEETEQIIEVIKEKERAIENPEETENFETENFETENSEIENNETENSETINCETENELAEEVKEIVS